MNWFMRKKAQKKKEKIINPLEVLTEKYNLDINKGNEFHAKLKEISSINSNFPLEDKEHAEFLLKFVKPKNNL